ncbi:alpha/beta hydrolase [Roseomonas sp. GC11]|uniref:alpha/beta hydrolase n=1 Tax=Roseomonas sp. GC11 TaxID=2950546 RepID=UPI00210A8EE5|nr:alpha/beta hydrolase [Roseomonas sp. GC11]MCQ4161841.1 alpha/beta hydrolase [Roseomonas sp. GC11]
MTPPLDGISEATRRGRQLYDQGLTTVYASRYDPRFSWCLYVPPGLDEPGPAPELIVSVHGTLRDMAHYRQIFVDFARWNRCIVLSPLFPAGVLGDGNRDGYKYIAEGSIRYDHVLLAMVDEVCERYRFSFDRFSLFGFSGGGHFAHRMLLLHPHRLWAVSIGAPGSVTLLDPQRDWWVGTRGMQARFGLSPNLEAMRQVAIHMVVGGADREAWEITHRENGRHWVPGANDAGATRPERLEALRVSLAAHGIGATLEIVPGVAHNVSGVVEYSKAFFARTLAARRAQPSA